MGQRAGECAFPVSFGRVDDHAGRLIYDDDGFVFVDDRERDVLRGRAGARDFDLIDDNAVAGFQPQRRLARDIVDADVAGIDGPLDGCPAECGKLLGEKHVQPAACIIRRDEEFLRPGDIC